MNFLLQTDSYKVSHERLFKPNLTYLSAYFESRGGEFDIIPFFGLQYYLKKYLCGQVINPNKIDEYKRVCQHHLGFFSKKWDDLLIKYDGILPLEIKAVPEGSKVGKKNVLFTVESTDTEFAFLVGYVETLLVKLWFPCVVSSQSYYIKNILAKYREETGYGDIDYQLHDFSYRGTSSEETAAIGAAANLLHFNGTDTIAGMLMLRDYYGTDIFAKSVPATEHSVSTTWEHNELDYFDNCLRQFPNGIISIVCDTYNQFKFINDVICERKEEILKRNGTVVIRLDSGEPRESILRSLDIISSTFPITLNDKGYKVLPSQLRLLQGDGISRFTIPSILEAMKLEEWSADNIVFGSGGSLCQKLNRDDGQYAYKVSHAIIDGQPRDICKNPFGDPTKRSKKGQLKLVKTPEGYTTISSTSPEFASAKNELIPVFRNGELLVDQRFEEIKDRINAV